MAFTGPVTDRMRQTRQRHADAAAAKLPSGLPKAQVKSVTIRPAQDTGMRSAVAAVRQDVAPTVQQPMSRTNQTLGALSSTINSEPFQFAGPEPFSYDPESDPAYQAALRTARDNIEESQANTSARLRARGQGNSSYSETVANQIGAQGMARVSNEVLPQLISQAYQRYADQSNRDLQTQQLNYGVGQDRLSNLANLYGLQNQEDFANPMAEAQLTGQYLPGEARQYIMAINDLKRQAEAPGITAAGRTDLSGQADAYRAALTGMGIDSSLFGADVTAADSAANLNRAGTPTLGGQAQQFDQDFANRQFERGIVESDRAYEYQQARDAIADEQWRAQFDEDVRRFGLDFALQQQQVRQSIANMAADNRRADAAAGRAASSDEERRLFQIWEATGVAPAGIPGVAPGTPLAGSTAAMPTAEDYLSAIDDSIYLSPEMAPSQVAGQGPTETGRTIVNDPEGLERYILSLGLPDSEAQKLYYRYGLRWGE